MSLWLSMMKRVNPQTSIDSNSTFCLWAPPSPLEERTISADLRPAFIHFISLLSV